MSAYWITTYGEISDQSKLDAYVELAGPAIREAGGTVLARGTPAKAYEHGRLLRTTLIRFDSVDQAVAAHESAGYQAALAALGDGAVRDIRIVDGG